MAENMFWFWNAAKDHYGTTVSYDTMSKPQKITAAFIKKTLSMDSG